MWLTDLYHPVILSYLSDMRDYQVQQQGSPDDIFESMAPCVLNLARFMQM